MSRGLRLILLTIASSCNASAQDVEPTDVTVTVQELESSLQVGSDKNSSVMRLAARVIVQNHTEQPLRVARNQFELLVNGRTIEPGLLESSPALEPTTLQPSEIAEGWIWYSFIDFDGTEPRIVLQWSAGQDASTPVSTDVQSALPKLPAVEIDLNREFRRLGSIEKRSLGPDGCLLQISVRRNLDVVAVWTLKDELKHAAAAGIQRIVFVPVNGTRPVVMDEFVLWLAALTQQSPGEPTFASPFPKAEYRFRHLSLGGLSQAANRRFNSGRGSVQIHVKPEDAVCASLTPLYRFVPVEQAITDLRNPDSGIRRAAMAGAVDRLTAEQAVIILERARDGNEELQIEVAAYLNLIPGKGSVETLLLLSLSGKARVSAVALRALANSRDSSTEKAMAEVWAAGIHAPALQAEIVSAILESQDDRWAPLMAAYVSDFVSQSVGSEQPVQPAEQSGETVLPGDGAATIAGPVSEGRRTVASRDPMLSRVMGALEYLQERGQQDTLILTRRSLLQISNSAIQDVFLEFLMRVDDDADEALIRACVNRRLEAGQISDSVRSAAIVFRDSEWTDALMADPGTPGDRRAPHFAMKAVLQCASLKQLDGLMAQFHTMNAIQKDQLLIHLALTEHPGWQDLAAELIESPGELSSEAIQLLGQDASEQSLLLLRTRLVAFAAGLEGTSDASIDGQRFFQALLAQLSMFAHPECRRVMNRLARDSNEYVRENVVRRIFETLRRSPAFRSIEAARKSRGAGQFEDEFQLLNVAINLDPLLTEAYVQRASAHMHADRFNEAMADLQTSDRLSPEDIEVLALIALVKVRMGQIESGVVDAEHVISLSPKNWISLYNGACTLARAADSRLSPDDQKLKYADRAIQLLLQTADLKFSDVEHLQKDADLTALHEHVMWPEVVSRVTANKVSLEEKPKADK